MCFLQSIHVCFTHITHTHTHTHTHTLYSQREASTDPNVLTGIPCCPGVIEGTVRVVTSIDQTEVRKRQCFKYASKKKIMYVYMNNCLFGHHTLGGCHTLRGR